MIQWSTACILPCLHGRRPRACRDFQHPTVLWILSVMTDQSAVPDSTQTASENYEKAKASVSKATSNFSEVPTISAKEVVRLREEGKKVLLVDVRTEEEIAVSFIQGAVTREEFEQSQLGEAAKAGRKFQEGSSSAETADDELVIPYCTVGYRSGQYAKKLQELGYPSVRNSEGVVMWTHDVGSGLVTREARDGKKAQSVKESGESSSNQGSSVDAAPHEVKRVHVYGSPWDHARGDFETVTFTSTGMIASGFKSMFSKIFRR